MRRIWVMAIGLIIAISTAPAQTETIEDIEFTYDAAGNRTHREIIYYEGGAKSTQVFPEEEEPEIEQGLNVYPNPASHSLYVSLNEEVLEEDFKMIILFDNLGRQVYQSRTLEEIHQIDVSKLPEATYILKLIYGNRHKEWIIIKN